MSSNLLRLLTISSTKLSRSLLRKPRYLNNLLIHRSVQEFPGLKYDNIEHKDYVLILPEVNNQTAETNEALRIPKRDEPETDYSKMTLESTFLGVHQAIGNFENFATDFNNGLVKSDKSLKEFFKLLEDHLYPMDTAFFALAMLNAAKPSEYYHKEIVDLSERYYRAREIRFSGNLRSFIHAYFLKDTTRSELSDVDKKMLSIYNTLGPRPHKLNQEFIGSVALLRDHLKNSTREFVTNIRNANSQFSHTVDDPDIIAAISSEFDDCQDLHHKERTPLKITADTYSKFMQFCPDRFVRQMLWETYNKRCSPKGPSRNNNTLFISRIQVQKRKIADYLGYRTHFEYKMDNAIAKSRREILDNLKMLNETNRPKMSELLEELYDFACENNFEDPSRTGIQEFDVDYLTHKYTYDVLIGKSESELKAFFPLDTVMVGLRNYFKNYFDIEITPKSDTKLWSDHVESMDVSRGGKVQGTIIFDPLKLDSKKQSGILYSRVRGRHNEKDCPPIRYASCSYIVDPAINKAHLSPLEVINLFNLYATVIQRLLYNYEYYELNLYGTLENEVVNLLPNLCMAHLLTDHRILQSCSNRGQSKPIDSGMSSKILKALQHFKPLKRWQALYRAHLDIEFYTSMRDMKVLAKEVYTIYSPFESSPNNFDYCAMSSIMIPPDDGTLYADIWSKQLANYCLLASISSKDQVYDISQVEVEKLRNFNVKLVDALMDPENLGTSDKLAALTGSSFEPSKSSLGVL